MKYIFLIGLLVLAAVVVGVTLTMPDEATAQAPSVTINGLAVMEENPECGKTFTVHANVTNQGAAPSAPGIVTLQNVHRGSGTVNFTAQEDYPSIPPGGNYIVPFRVKFDQYISRGYELIASTNGQVFRTKYDVKQGNCGKPSDVSSGDYYEIQARHSKKCLDVRNSSISSGADIQQYSCHGGANQQWTLQSAGNGYYEIVSRNSGKCLDVKGASKDDRATVQQYSCHNGDNQEFRLEHIDAGYFLIVAKHSGKCLDVRGADTSDLATVQQYFCNKNANQQWRLR